MGALEEGHFDAEMQAVAFGGGGVWSPAGTIEDAVKVLLNGLGEDPDREGLRKTPMRVAKAFREGTRAISFNSHASSVTMFSGINFSEWREQVNFQLGIMDLDLALLEEKPTAIIDASSDEEKLYYKTWERSNRLALMFMRMTVANNIRTTLPQTENAKDFMKSVEERFRAADKSLAGTLMAELTTIKFDGSRTMQEHIIEMTNLTAKLRALGMTVEESFLVQFILNSLPSEFGPFQINYNTTNEKWNVNELASKLVQEEMRLKKQGGHSINYASHKGGSQLKVKGKAKFKKSKEPAQASQADKKELKDKCHFCKKVGHYQKDCLKRKTWFEKKGISFDPNHKSK